MAADLGAKTKSNAANAEGTLFCREVTGMAYTVKVVKYTAAFRTRLYLSAYSVMTKGIHGFQISSREAIM